MRLIFVNRFFYPDYSATSQMLTDLAFGLVEKGVDVTVITSRLRYDEPKAHLTPRETTNGVRVERIWTSRFGRSGLLFRTIDYLTFYLSAAWILARTSRRGDIVIAMTDPPAFSIVAALVARGRGARVVNWLQDMFPEVAEALDVGKGSSSILFAILRALRNVSLRSATMNVAIGVLMAERLLKLGVSRDRIVVVPNWADIDAVRPVPAEENGLRIDWNLTGKFVIAYSGNLGRAHDTETLLGAIEATARPSPENSEIRWLFIGGGARYAHLKRETKRRGCNNVGFYPYQPRERLAESLSVADVHVVSLRPALEGLIVPSKFYGIAAAGRPALFIGCPDGEIARLIAQYGCGEAIALGDLGALAEAVRVMARDWKQCRDMGERARVMCEENFDKAKAITAWYQLIESVALSAFATPGADASATRPIEGPRKSSHEPAG